MTQSLKSGTLVLRQLVTSLPVRCDRSRQGRLLSAASCSKRLVVSMDGMETAVYGTLATVVELALPILVWVLVIAGLVTVVRDKQAEGSERQQPAIVLRRGRQPQRRKSTRAERPIVPLHVRR